MDFNFNSFIALFIAGLYGMFGSLVQYLYSIVKAKEERFSFSRLLINGIFGFFVGQVMGDFLPLDFAYRDGTLLISGFLVYQILGFVESKGLKTIIQQWLKADISTKK